MNHYEREFLMHLLSTGAAGVLNEKAKLAIANEVERLVLKSEKDLTLFRLPVPVPKAKKRR